MPITYELRDDTLWFVTVGEVDYRGGLRVLVEAFEAARAHDPKRRWNVVFDIRSSSENRSADELQGIASVVAQNDAVLSGRCAVVAGDSLHFGLARMFGTYAEGLGLDVTVVKDVPRAVAWLAGESEPPPVSD
jgi:hypothetical protein